MTTHARVAVIGGGAVGTSVLYHLAHETHGGQVPTKDIKKPQERKP